MYKRKKIITIIIVITALFVLTIWYFLQKSDYGPQLRIKNYDSKIKNLPNTRKQSIESMLYSTVKSNNADPQNVSDANIREGSNYQDYISDKKLYSGSFIVDLPSIKQSYVVNYKYSSIDNSIDNSGYPVLVSCLSGDKIIYSEFKCTDLLAPQYIDYDPIVKSLPYDTLKYRIRASVDSENKVTLIVNMDLSNEDYKIGREKSVNKYKAEISAWIVSLGLDPNKYTYDYIY